MENNDNKLELLTKKIYEEGIEKAQNDAQNILDKAQQEAENIVKEAEEKAKETIRLKELIPDWWGYDRV